MTNNYEYISVYVNRSIAGITLAHLGEKGYDLIDSEENESRGTVTLYLKRRWSE